MESHTNFSGRLFLCVRPQQPLPPRVEIHVLGKSTEMDDLRLGIILTGPTLPNEGISVVFLCGLGAW